MTSLRRNLSLLLLAPVPLPGKRPVLTAFVLTTLALITTGCDNVGRAFNPNFEPNDPGATAGTSIVQVVPVGGDVRDGRPRVRETYPDGSGWPNSVPIVVEFSESVNEASILPSTPTGIDGRVGVRVQGTQQLLPCAYDLVANGRLLILRPLTALAGNASQFFEVVLFEDARDVDGVRFSVPGGETVLSEFQVNQDESITDGRILAVFPRDNTEEQTREGDFWVVFDRPANLGTIDDANILLRPAGGAAIAVDLNPPLTQVGVNDGRVVRIRPDAPLSAATRYEFVVNAQITFGQDGQLDFRGRTPFSTFTTVAPAAPESVALGNAAPGFADKINRQNLLDVVLHVDTPADTVAGDAVVARIYGGDASTSQTGDLAFVERSAPAPANGAQMVMVGFPAELGPLGSPRFDDGEITFAARMQRGGSSSGFVHGSSDTDPTFDLTLPTLTAAGPASPDGSTLLTDLEYVAFYGSASEALANATLMVGNDVVPLFASGSGGRFLLIPVPVARQDAPRPYMLTLTDRAGNMSASAAVGNIVQRGFLVPGVPGQLTVEAYDESTLLPVANATVLVDDGVPTMPATAQRIGTTDAAGRVVFTGLSAASHTVTVVRAGYELVTLYDSGAGFASLPLRPDSGGTATLTGTAALTQAPGATVLVGSTALADRSVLGVRTSNAAPTAIPATPILANRTQVITAFAGSFEPTTIPTYGFQACQMCGPTFMTPTVPSAPAAPGEEVTATLALTQVGATFLSLLGPQTEEFGSATGLDLANLVTGRPRVRVTMSLQGFAGQTLAGVGFVTGSVGTAYDVNASYSAPIFAALAGFTPVAWLMTEAEDTAGRVSRVRVLLDPVAGNVTQLPGIGPPAIPAVTPPAGPSVGSPAVTFADVLNTPIVPAGIGYYDVTAADGAGRRWRVLVADTDGPGSRTVQFPDLQSNSVMGLQAGDWSVLVEARQFVSVTLSGAFDLSLSERFRQEVNYSRSQPAVVTVQ